MIKISIIGTAGRKHDISKLDKMIYSKMVSKVRDLVNEIIKINNLTQFELVSGGAAWTDHIAISLFKEFDNDKLTLYFPCQWDNDRHCFQSNGYRDTGNIANYYHTLFSNKMGYNTLEEIHQIVHNNKVSIICYNGFHNRNTYVAQSDVIIALTFNNDNIPNDGGTLDTWKKSKASLKIHININEL